MSYKVNPLLAKLLAKEDITVQSGNYSTAWFDVKHRVLGLPNWKDMGKNVYDLLVGHEVGHALYTPEEGFHANNEMVKGCPKSYLNVIEDARIERFIQRDYPGLVSCFSKGYTSLFSDGVFGDIDPAEVPSMKLIDRMNLKAKLGSRLDVPFNDEEQILFNRSLTNQTWEDVCNLVRDIVAYEDEDKNEQDDPEDSEEQTDGSGEQEGSDQQKGNNDQDEDQESDDSGEGQPEQENEDEDDGDSQGMSDDESESESRGQVSSNGTDGSTTGYGDLDGEEKSYESLTDANFRNNEDKFINTDKEGNIIFAFEDYSKNDLTKIIVPYSEIKQARLKQEADANKPFRVAEIKTCLTQYTKTKLKEYNKNVQPAVREFEARKAAYEYQRSATANKGTLDVDKLFSYRYNEDIFSSLNIKADAKNHGLFMLLDLSGSMQQILSEVIEQTLTLICFCRATNIPFKLYGFTTGNDTERNEVSVLSPDTMSCSLVELASSDLNSKDMATALEYIAFKGVVYSYSTPDKAKADASGLVAKVTQLRYCANAMIPHKEGLGATPFNQALMASRSLMINFKAKHRIQKLTLVTLCDGDAAQLNSLWCYEQDKSKAETEATITEKYNDTDIVLKVGSDEIKTYGDVSCRGPRQTIFASIKDRKLTTKILESIKTQIGIESLGFFVSSGGSNFNYRIVGAMHSKDSKLSWDHGTNDQIKKKAAKEYSKRKCVSITKCYGYDNYFIVKGGTALSVESNFEVETDAKPGQIKNAFGKFAKGKKTNKVLLESFARAIC